MFNKKYSPIVLTKISMVAYYLAEKTLRFVLHNEMVRFLHMTMDETKWDEPAEGIYSETHQCKSEISGTVLCKNDIVVDFEIENLLLRRHTDGEWVSLRRGKLRFPHCKALRGWGLQCMFDETEEGSIDIWTPNNGYKKISNSPEDKGVSEVRKILFAI